MHLLNLKYILLALGIVALGAISAETIAEAQHFKGKTIDAKFAKLFKFILILVGFHLAN